MTDLQAIPQKETKGPTAGPPAGTQALPASRIELVLNSIHVYPTYVPSTRIVSKLRSPKVAVRRKCGSTDDCMTTRVMGFC